MKKINPFLAVLGAAALIVSAMACSDTADDLYTEPDLYKLGEFTDNGLTITVWAERPLITGYNMLYVDLHEDGEHPAQADISLTPVMHMDGHSHASPFEDPGSVRDETQNLYRGWVIFTMPSGMAGHWELQVTATLPSGTDVTGVVDIEVEESGRVQTFLTENEERYVLTLIEPAEPETGMNDLEIALHRRESMMHFPPVTDASFRLEPWMPSMGHGSNNNMAPVHTDNGFYQGEVNFNMTGDWELRFDIETGENVLGRHVFNLEF